MAEQRKTTPNTRETEKTVHDLTKQEDLTRVLDQSLRALQEMEQRLQALEQELGSIGARPGQPHPPRAGVSHAAGQQQYIGAPNPHGLHNPLMMPFMPQAQAPTNAQHAAGPWQNAASHGGAGSVAAPFGQFAPQAHAADPGAHFDGQQFFAADPMARLAQLGPFAMRDPTLAYAAAGADPMAMGAGAGGSVSEAMQLGQPDMGGAGQLAGRSQDIGDVSPQVRQPIMDVVDRNEEFLIHWELPGVKKDNLDIMVTDKSLILNAKAFPEHEDGVVVHTERPPAVYRRTVPFQTDVDTSKAKAELKDGVLTVHVPKSKPSNGPKRLDVAYG